MPKLSIKIQILLLVCISLLLLALITSYISGSKSKEALMAQSYAKLTASRDIKKHVVADEVRKLAERTQKSLTEINATINIIVQSIVDVSTQMNINSDEIHALAHSASEVEIKINESVPTVDRAVRLSEKTASDFENTRSNVQSIVTQISQVNTISSHNARSVEEIAAAAEHLNAMTDTLRTKLEIFRT